VETLLRYGGDGLACRVPSAYGPGGRFGTSRLDFVAMNIRSPL